MELEFEHEPGLGIGAWGLIIAVVVEAFLVVLSSWLSFGGGYDGSWWFSHGYLSGISISVGSDNGTLEVVGLEWIIQVTVSSTGNSLSLWCGLVTLFMTGDVICVVLVLWAWFFGQCQQFGLYFVSMVSSSFDAWAPVPLSPNLDGGRSPTTLDHPTWRKDIDGWDYRYQHFF